MQNLIDGIVGVSVFSTTIHPVSDKRVERPSVGDTRRQVGIGNEGSAERDHVGQPGFKEPGTSLHRVLASVDDATGINLTHRLAEAQRKIGSIVPVPLGNRNISDTGIFEQLDSFDLGAVRVLFDESNINAVLLGALEQWGKAHTEPILTNRSGHRRNNLTKEAQPVFK
jgi:hypothetical protein